MTKPGDVDHFTRVRCYEAVMRHYPDQTTAMALLHLAMRMAGPREALWHALIRRNHGCTHFVVGRDHAGPGKNSQGEDFYGPYDAQEMVAKYADEIGIEMVPFQAMVYVQERAQYVPINEVAENETKLNISGTELRRRLREGLDINEWFSYPDVVAELRKTHPPRDKQGFTLFFTGLSGSGKSTIANAVMVKLLEAGGRPVTLLDGDLVRKNLSSELTFSKEHRDLNILRIGYVASEITKNGGIAICAPIAPYERTRSQVRDLIEPLGGFLEIHVATSLEVCEGRDRKGLYAKARAGLIKEFTGIDDPYEEPQNAELVPAFALKIKDAIDHMFDHARPCNLAIFGDMTHQDHAHPTPFGEGNQFMCRGAHLADRSRSAVDCVKPHGLDGIDDHQIGAGFVQSGQNIAQIGFRRQGHRGCAQTQTLRAHAHLCAGLLARDINNRQALGCETGRSLQQ